MPKESMLKNIKKVKKIAVIFCLMAMTITMLSFAKWQYQRALQKEAVTKILLQQLQQKSRQTVIRGIWGNEFYIIDNVYRHGQVGYELWQHFLIVNKKNTKKEPQKLLLIRGWWDKRTEPQQLTLQKINDKSLFWWKNLSTTSAQGIQEIQISPPLTPLLNIKKQAINQQTTSNLLAEGFEINNTNNVPENLQKNWQNWQLDEEAVLKRFSPHKHYSYMGQWLFFSCISLLTLLFFLKKTFSSL